MDKSKRSSLYQQQKIKVSEKLSKKLNSFRMDTNNNKIPKRHYSAEDVTGTGLSPINPLESMEDLDWRNKEYFTSGDVVEFGDFAIKFEFDKLKENYFLFLRKANTNKPTKKQNKDPSIYLSWSAQELKETVAYLEGVIKEVDEGEVGEQLPSLKLSDKGHLVDAYEEDFWADRNLTKTLSGERMKMRVAMLGGSVVVVFWAIIPDHIREKYDGWIGPQIRLHIGGMRVFSGAGKRYLESAKKKTNNSQA